MHSYPPTGYGPGRPRKGEIRPPSPNAIVMAGYRKRRHERDPSFKDILAEKARKWKAENLERSKEIEHNSYLRHKAWLKAVKNKESLSVAEGTIYRNKIGHQVVLDDYRGIA